MPSTMPVTSSSGSPPMMTSLSIFAPLGPGAVEEGGEHRIGEDDPGTESLST